MEDEEKFEMKGVGPLFCGRKSPDNLYAFPIRGENEIAGIKCQKCGTILTGEKVFCLRD